MLRFRSIALITFYLMFCCGPSLCHAQRTPNRAHAPDKTQEELLQDLVEAIRTEDLDGVREAIDAGVDVCALVPDDRRKVLGIIADGWATPMYIAACVGNVAIMRELCEAGADVREGFYQYFPHRSNPRFFTALYGLATSTYTYIKDGLKRKSLKPELLAAPIHRAAIQGHLDAVKFLLAHGEDIDRKSWFNFTPLLLAGVKGYCDLIKYLCRQGADRSVIDPFSSLSLQESARYYAGDDAASCFDPAVFKAKAPISS